MLSQKEESILDQKLKRFQGLGLSKLNADTSNETQTTTLTPEKYSEDTEKVIRLTERELNSLLAKNTDLSDKLVIDLSDNLLSVKLLIPIDQEFPFIGGKTIKVTAGYGAGVQKFTSYCNVKGCELNGCANT